MTSWTKNKPSEPGWYWRRVRVKGSRGSNYIVRPTLVAMSMAGLGHAVLCYESPSKSRRRLSDDVAGEWWPIPLQPPTEETP